MPTGTVLVGSNEWPNTLLCSVGFWKATNMSNLALISKPLNSQLDFQILIFIWILFLLLPLQFQSCAWLKTYLLLYNSSNCSMTICSVTHLWRAHTPTNTPPCSRIRQISCYLQCNTLFSILITSTTPFYMLLKCRPWKILRKNISIVLISWNIFKL